MERSMPAFAMLIVLGALVIAACGGSSRRDESSSIIGELATEVVASGFSSPLYLTAPPSDPRLFIVEQSGRIHIVENGQLLTTPFLDVSSEVARGGEQGLLSMAFHPQYASNGYFYVNYTDANGDTRIERYTVSANRNVANPNPDRLIFSVAQPFPNHNGGLILFGLDGMLYIAMGDGGGGGDPQGNGQDLNTLHGALLRIDVDGGNPYVVPPDNPFTGNPNARDEIWAHGLRNPWRLSFDPKARLLYVSDVGESNWEEVSVVSDTSGGLNYGWNIMEGAHCFNGSSCNTSGLVLPVLEYGHQQGCSITGGYVYRGNAIPAIQGHYFYSDFCAGFLRSFVYANGITTDPREWDVGNLGNVVSFGEDASGELYILSQNGNVYRLVSR
jgi:glucose/arabinose dehydrogenase